MNDAQLFDSPSFPGDIDMYPMSNIEQIERTFCTNFSCCNIVFPDLHALLDHYDTTTTGAHSIYSTPRTPVASSFSPSPSPSSSSSSSSPSTSPSAPSSPESPNAPPYTLWPTHASLLSPSPTLAHVAPAGCASTGDVPTSLLYVYHSDAYAFSEYPTYEHCYHAAVTPAPAPVLDGAPSQSQSQSQSQSPLSALLFPDALHAPLLHPHSHSPLSSAPSSPSLDSFLPYNNSSNSNFKPKPKSGSTSKAKAKARLTSKSGGKTRQPTPASALAPAPAPPRRQVSPPQQTSPDLVSTTQTLSSALRLRKMGAGTGTGTGKRRGKVDLDGVPLAAARRRGARKAYQCPTPGCTKSYLNPNGLKYHLEKGTCKIEGVLVVSRGSLLEAGGTTAATTNATTDASGNANPAPDVDVRPDPAPMTGDPSPSPPHTEHQHRHIHQPQPRQLHQGSVDMLEQWSVDGDGGSSGVGEGPF